MKLSPRNEFRNKSLHSLSEDTHIGYASLLKYNSPILGMWTYESNPVYESTKQLFRIGLIKQSLRHIVYRISELLMYIYE